MSDTPKSILVEIVMHFSRDSFVNGSTMSKYPVGRLAISDQPNTLWRRACDVLVQVADPHHETLWALLEELAANGKLLGVPLGLVGILPLSMSEDSTWKRVHDIVSAIDSDEPA